MKKKFITLLVLFTNMFCMNRNTIYGLYKTLILVGLISFVGCSDKEVEQPVGDPRTPDLILNKDSIMMDAAGGVDTLIVENYNEWAVTGGYTIIDGDTTDYHLEPAMQMPYDYKHYLLRGEWFKLEIPNLGKSNKAVVTLEPNDTEQERVMVAVMFVLHNQKLVTIRQRGK